MKLLGCVIDGLTRKPIKDHQKQILDFQKPTKKKELQRFLGFANYYRNYINNLATIAQPLYDALKGVSDTSPIIWTSECEKSFIEIKNKINADIAVHLPDFSKPFILITDASGTGIGASLQQEIENETRVIDFASKKLTTAEKKYTITEKEFFAMAWAIEHYGYYLKGREFKVITDHSALCHVHVKHIFGNDKLDRMRDKLQSYRFSIEYRKGKELIEADAVSRIYENKEEDFNHKTLPKNTVVDSEGIWYYKVNEHELKIFPKVEDRKKILQEAHEETTAHAGRDAMYYEIKKKYYWPKIKESIIDYLKSCVYCATNDQKSQGGEEFVETTKIREIFAFDLMFIEQTIPVLTCIDYFSRKCTGRVLKSKKTEHVFQAFEDILKELGKPDKIITDQGKEFFSSKFKTYCKNNVIEHHMTSPGKHQGNGRIERLHRTIWQALRKYAAENDKIDWDSIVYEIFLKLNNTYHRGIKATPNELWNSTKNSLIDNEKYKKEFEKHKREKFNENDLVYVADLNTNTSSYKLNSKFDILGKITEVLENDSYNVEINGKITKRNHYHLKKRNLA